MTSPPVCSLKHAILLDAGAKHKTTAALLPLLATVILVGESRCAR